MRRSDIPSDHPFHKALVLSETHTSGLIELPLIGAPVLHQFGQGVLLAPIGMVGFYAGPEVMIWDRFALSDPIGARFEPVASNRRKGHEKFIEDAWFDARMAGSPLSSDKSSIAAEFLECPGIKDLLTGISAPLTSEIFWYNVRLALSDTLLRFPSDPADALDSCDAIS